MFEKNNSYFPKMILIIILKNWLDQASSTFYLFNKPPKFNYQVLKH